METAVINKSISGAVERRLPEILVFKEGKAHLIFLDCLSDFSIDTNLITSLREELQIIQENLEKNFIMNLKKYGIAREIEKSVNFYFEMQKQDLISHLIRWLFLLSLKY